MTPIFRVLAGASDITGKIADRLISLKTNDEAGLKSDTAEIVLDNRDLKVAAPRKGVELQIFLGYKETGLVLMGLYTADEVEIGMFPDDMTIRAKAANMSGAFKAPKSRAWDDLTIGDLVNSIADTHGYKPAVSPELLGQPLGHVDQTEESDMHLLTRLADQYGAVAKPANGSLLFVPRGDAKSATGKTMSPVVVTRADLTAKAIYTSADRGKFPSVSARWHDLASNQDMTVTVGDGTPLYVMRNSFADAEAAQVAAQAKLEALDRGTDMLTLSIVGRPQARAEAPLHASGLHPEVDASPWTITKVGHELSDKGLSTKIEAEGKTK